MQVIGPRKTGQPRDDKRVAECTAVLKKSLDIIEDYFLKDKPFIGGDEISIAGTSQMYSVHEDLNVHNLISQISNSCVR